MRGPSTAPAHRLDLQSLQAIGKFDQTLGAGEEPGAEVSGDIEREDGAEGSGTALIAERILKVAGLSPDGDLASLRLDVRESATALAEGRIDAFFWSGGLPTGAITDLRRSTTIRLVDLGGVVGELTRSYGELYTETTVPAVVYGAQSAVTTVSVPNFLVVRRDMPDSEAYWLTRLLFEGQSQLIGAHPEARRLDRRTAIATHPLELHPGAARWYRESHP
ncbi:TAXI family TRAP transporter solute-binding subunit [Streptomyces sp. NPDC006365]|uniref:TAXI family TRAP transporter solute-binding subunit n=1 Tax=Streptomyces sp. NPDC006365 TaxID=3364744 RepID=UPI0036B574F4